MRKIKKYLEWLPFAIALGSIVIYIVYTLQIKLNPSIIVTDKLISTLKIYLIISLVSLFIGLLVILIKKIRRLMLIEPQENKYKTLTKEKVVLSEPKVDNVITIKEETTLEDELKKETTLADELKKEIVEKSPIIKEEIKETIIEPKVEEPYIKEEKIIYTEPKKEYIYKVKGIVCPECNNPISKNAAICPHCGILFDDEIIKVLKKYDKRKYKVKRRPLSTVANILLTIVFIILIFLICNMLYNKYNSNLKNISSIMQRR